MKLSSKALSLIALLAILASVAFIEFLAGRIPICACGYIKLWAGNVFSRENSQMISDWYTFSHIIHGLIFYFLLWKFAKKVPSHWRLVVALLVESIWEIIENNSFMIERYRSTTVSVDYFGDSILNSLSDIGAMMIGYWVASKLPVKVSVVLIILMELVVAYVIHDNLTLNVIMLFYPFPSILKWQSGL